MAVFCAHADPSGIRFCCMLFWLLLQVGTPFGSAARRGYLLFNVNSIKFHIHVGGPSNFFMGGSTVYGRARSMTL